MKEEIQKIKEEAIKEIGEIQDKAKLNEIKVKYLGKKGSLTKTLKNMGGLTPEERPIIGKLANEVRDLLEETIEKKEKEINKKELEKRLETENIDITEPSKKEKLGSIHPITKIIK